MSSWRDQDNHTPTPAKSDGRGLSNICTISGSGATNEVANPPVRSALVMSWCMRAYKLVRTLGAATKAIACAQRQRLREQGRRLELCVIVSQSSRLFPQFVCVPGSIPSFWSQRHPRVLNLVECEREVIDVTMHSRCRMRLTTYSQEKKSRITKRPTPPSEI